MPSPVFLDSLAAWWAISPVLGPADAGLLATSGVLAFLASFWLTAGLIVAGPAWRHLLAALLALGLLCGAAVEWGGVQPEPQDAPRLLASCLPTLAGLALLGILVGWMAAAGSRCRSPFHLGSALALGFGMSLLWVSSYQYLYNIPMLNSPHLNYSSFLLWGTGLCTVVGVNRKLETWVEPVLARSALLWLLYLLALFVYEYIGYEVLQIHEVSKGLDHPAMFLGLIHGPASMKAFYLSAGLLVVWLDQAYRATRLGLSRRQMQWQRG